MLGVMTQIDARDHVAQDQLGVAAGIAPPVPCQLNDTTFPNQNFFKRNIDDLFRWIAQPDTFTPAAGQLITLSGPIPADGDLTSPLPTIVSDAYGNVEGGVRLAQIAVPRANYTIVNPPMAGYAADWCAAALRGSTNAFSTDQLHYLYQNNFVYLQEFAVDTLELVREGYLLVQEGLNDVATATRTMLF